MDSELRAAFGGGCMKTYLHLPAGLYEELRTHLLPLGNTLEQAAFLFTATSQDQQSTRFDLVEVEKLTASDFDEQGPGYLELSDETRKRLIKRAHDLKTSLVEMH